jgi:DNA recombination protein RmuC
VLPTARKLNALDASGLVTPPAVQVTPRSLAAPELQGESRQRDDLHAAELAATELEAGGLPSTVEEEDAA